MGDKKAFNKLTLLKEQLETIERVMKETPAFDKHFNWNQALTATECGGRKECVWARSILIPIMKCWINHCSKDVGIFEEKQSSR
jgi:hypothetical protein